MKGHIRKRSKDSWTIVIDIGRDLASGKRCQKWHTVKGTKRDAQRALREILTSLDKGIYVEPTNITLGEWLGKWLNSYVSLHTTPRTQESYRYITTRHLLPELGTIPLNRLAPQHLQDYYAKALSQGRCDGRGGLSARSVLYHHRILSEALSHAMKIGLIARNVATVVDPPRPRRITMNTLSHADVSKFLEAAKDDPVFYVLFCTLLYTGLRRGELLALRWRNLDLDLSELHVLETAYKLSNGEYVIKEPKTMHSRRRVSLPPSLALLLRQYRKDQERFFAAFGKQITDDDFVFSQCDGSPFNPNHATRTFGKVIRRAGLHHLRLHDLRHTHATLMLKAGIHPKIVSERLGHANINITLDTYSHVVPGLQEAAAERFDRMMDEHSENNFDKADVSNMLAKDQEVERRPCRSRTCDTLIKSQVDIFPVFGVFSKLESARVLFVF
jgi:integrase